MFTFQVVVVLALALFIAFVTIGDELGALLGRILDLFHPTDRQFRQIYRASRLSTEQRSQETERVNRH